MKKQIKVNLFGATGERQIDITSRGGFPTRHIVAPRETVPSIFEPVQKDETVSTPSRPLPETPKSDAVSPPTIHEVLRWMEASEDFPGWLIIDEILFVATTQYKMKFNHNTLLNALRLLFQKGVLEYRLNRFNQHTFRLIEKQQKPSDLKTLLAEVDAVIGKEDAKC